MVDLQRELDYIKNNNVDINYELFEYLVSKTQSFEEVKLIQEFLVHLGLKKTEKFYELLFKLSENYREAKKVIVEMEQNGYKPDNSWYHILFWKDIDDQDFQKAINYFKKIHKREPKFDDIQNPTIRYYEKLAIKELRIKLRNKYLSIDLVKCKQKESEEKELQQNIKQISEEVIKEDIDAELFEEHPTYKEGAVQEYYGKRYERNPESRKKAIEIHGLNCVVCGFNFEEVYGERGKDFIEVHHVKPLSTIKEEVEINPETDLVPVCANCHRMIHRRKDDVLTIEELKSIVAQRKIEKD
ncbi:HNH endonuclease [Parageobacillus toebii]|uniref:HNH endonuclease n=1 Tax=Parageobacillus toebii TaxID=153151 RepID=UPI002E2180BE|nr:HNH endonuclease [Parageobacillus toebii]MED4990883.1 HNH endonuclease [Parageobacillus toebii]